MAKIAIESDAVKITFAFQDRLFTLNGELKIPLSHIIGVTPAGGDANRKGRFRMPVIPPPRPKMAGIFINELGHTLWDVENIDKAVAIYFAQETYFAAVVEVDHPDYVIEAVTHAIANRART